MSRIGKSGPGISWRELPTALVVVAALFLLSGSWSLVEVVSCALDGTFRIDFVVLAIPIAFGLLSCRRGWRTLALIFLLGSMLVGACLSLGFCYKWVTGVEPNLRCFGRDFGPVRPLVALSVVVPLWCLVVWQYRVLQRPDVRVLFGLNAGHAAALTAESQVHEG